MFNCVQDTLSENLWITDENIRGSQKRFFGCQKSGSDREIGRCFDRNVLP